MTPEEIQVMQVELKQLKDRLDVFERLDRFRIFKNVELPKDIGIQFGTGAKEKLAFWGVKPVIQPVQNVGTVGHYPIGGTTVGYQDQFTGADVSSSKYSINGIVDSLKAVGIIAK